MTGRVSAEGTIRLGGRGSAASLAAVGSLAFGLLLLLALVAFPGGAGAQTAANDQSAVEPVTTNGCDGEQVTMKTREYEVLQAHNRYRVSKGLKPFCVDPALQAVAQAHSTDRATRNFYGHVNPDGESPFDRLQAANYDCWPMGGENIAVKWTYATAAETTQAWIASTGHRANIESVHHVRIGIGSATDEDFSRWYYPDDPDWGAGVHYTVNFAGSDCREDPVDPPPDDGGTDGDGGTTVKPVNVSAPVIKNVVPSTGATVRDKTPRFSAVVRDSQTDIAKRHIRVFVDGVQLPGYKITYDASADKLRGESKRLKMGKRHTLKIVAVDGKGKSSSKSVRFLVAR